MNVKSHDLSGTWVDPDDAPELTDEFFENATWQIGDRIVSREEAMAEMRRHPVNTSIPLDADVVAAFQATGQGWQARMNDVLRDWLRSREGSAGQS